MLKRPRWRAPSDCGLVVLVVNDPIEALRARVATLNEAQRETLRIQLKARGIAWERVQPAEQELVRPERLPLSPSQLHFWILQQIHPDSSAHHIAFAWHIDGALDAAALEESFRLLQERHEPLRTCFPAENGVPWQQIGMERPFTLGKTDLRTDLGRLDACIRAVVDQPFDLAAGPMMRAHLFRLQERRYCLAINLHHIVADGWSRGILIRELASCYRARRSGRKPDLPPLSTHFADLVLERQNWLKSPDCQNQKSFWQEKLADLAEQELPCDHPLGGIGQSRASETAIQALPEELSRKVRAVATQLGATPFMLLLAVFKLLLHRYTGERDLAIGVPVAGRRETEAGLIGLFVNTLVLRTAVDPGLRFDEWLSQVRTTFADAFERQDIPFAQVVDALGVERNAGRNPLFQVLFQVQTEGYGQQNAETIDLGDPDLAVRQEMLPLREAKFDLSWHMMERSGGLSLAVEYRTGLFDAERISRMIGHFEHLLGSVLATPRQHLPELDYLPPDEHAELWAKGMGEEYSLPDLCVCETVTASTERYPDKTALICGPRALSYRQVEDAVDRLARRLVAEPASAGSNVRIGICLPRDIDLPVSLLAVLRAGMAYVPLDPDHPVDRLAAIMDDADVSLVLARDAALACGRPFLDPTAFSDAPGDVILPVADPSRTAYLIYTSGSTGRPKGVPILHSSLSNLLAAMKRRPGMDEDSRLLAVTTVAFDIAGLELLLPLVSGATVVLADRDTVLSPEALIASMELHDITHMQATPALWRMLLDTGWTGRPQLTALCGGEALDTVLAQRLMPLVGSLWNVYGPTETTIWSGALKVEPQHLAGQSVRVGGPIDNTQFHVLDAYHRPVPFGIPGELFIGGAGLSPGYWRKPELTAAAFIEHPSGMRLYRTGDRVSRRADGEMEFLGRVDHQVKLRGYRIETGEIESILLSHPRVAQALVVLDANRERLIAYCRLKPEEADADIRQALRDSLARQVPRYMIPAAFVILEAFPLNGNGKIDRKRLPLPEDEARPEAAAEQPQNDHERILLDIWRRVLRRDDIGVNDNFFDVGGDSISGMQIVARAKAEGLMLEAAQIFEHQTTRALAVVAQQKSATPEQLPLSPWQRHVRDIETPPWIVLLPIDDVPHSAFEAAVRLVAARHPVLGFRLADEWSTGDIGHRSLLMEDANDTALIDWSRSIKDEGPLWQAAVCGPSDRRQLVVVAHPLLLDAPSVSFLSCELAAAVSGRSEGRSPASTSAGRYSEWLRRTDLAAPPAQAPSAGVAAPIDVLGQAYDPPVNTALSLAQARDLSQKAERQRLTVEMVALAALSDALRQWSGEPLLQIDLLTSGRFGEEQKGWGLGNFNRLLPIVLAPSRGSVLAAAGVLSDTVSQIQRRGADPASRRRDVLVIWTEMPGEHCRWLSVAEVPPPPGYALVISVRHRPDGMQFDWYHDPARFNRSAVERIAARHLAELTTVPANPGQQPPKLDRLLTQLKHRKR